MPTAVTFTADAGTDTLTATAHGLNTGDRCRTRNTGGALPTGLAAVTTYFAIRLTADTLKIATSSANAAAGTAIDITGAGTGTHTLEYGLPYCEPRISAPGQMIRSEDDNATWSALTALHALLTGQSQGVWSAAKLTVPVEVGNTMAATGAISPSALAAGTTNNYDPAGLSGASVLRVGTNVVGSALGGLAGGAPGRMILLVNLGPSGDLTLVNEGGDSDAAKRFSCVNEGNQAIRPFGGATLWYDGATSRWLVVGVNA